MRFPPVVSGAAGGRSRSLIIAVLAFQLLSLRISPVFAQSRDARSAGLTIESEISPLPESASSPQDTSITFRSGSGCSGLSGASIATLLNFWGAVTPLSSCYDLNHDGVINSADLAILLATPPDPLAPKVGVMAQSDVFHLYERAAFGYVSDDMLQKTVGASVDSTVAALFEVQPDTAAELRALEWKDERCCNVVDPVTGAERNPGAPKLLTTYDGATLYALTKMGETRNPAIEFLVFRVLHELVTAGVSAVGRDSADIMLMIRNEVPGFPTKAGYFDLLHQAALDGDYPTLIKKITRLPAMLRYLNGDANTASQPNQNYARELMELFTLGPTDQNGAPNYTNADIGEAARALTGFQITETEIDSGFFRQPFRRYEVAAQTSANPNFDSGTKFLFAGTAHRCSVVTADDLIDCIFRHPAAAPYLATQIGIHYVRTDIATAYPEVVAALARDLEENGFNIVATIQKLLRSDFFYRPENRDALLRSPTEKAVHVYRALRARGMNHMPPPCANGDTACYALCPNGSPQNCAYFASATLNAPLNPSALLDLVTKGVNRPADPPNVFAWRDHGKYFASATGLITLSNTVVNALSHWYFNAESGPDSAIARWGFTPSHLLPPLPTASATPPLHVVGTNNYNSHRDLVIRSIARLLSFEPNEAQMAVAREFLDSSPESLTNGTYSFQCLCSAAAAASHPDGLTTPPTSCATARTECGPSNAPWNPFLFQQRRKKVFGLFELFIGSTDFNT